MELRITNFDGDNDNGLRDDHSDVLEEFSVAFTTLVSKDDDPVDYYNKTINLDKDLRCF